MNKNFFGFSLTITTITLILGAGCNNATRFQNETKNNTEPVRIGFVGPLTGEVASVGENIKKAIEFARYEINSNPGNVRKVEVVFEDGKCEGKSAANAAAKLINTDKVKIIIGGVCSNETLAIAPLAETAKVILLSPASTNPDITNSGDYIFRLMPSDTFQGKFVADYIYNTLQKRRVAVLFNNDQQWSTSIKNVFTERFNALGGEVVAEQGVPSTENDLRPALSAISKATPDFLYFPSFVDSGIIGLRQAQELNLKIPILGGDVWDDPKMAERVKAFGNNVRFTIAMNRELPHYYKLEMKKRTGQDEPDTYSPRAYDAIKILYNIVKLNDESPDTIKRELYKLSSYQGVADTYSLDPNGDVSIGNYVIKEFRDGKIIKAE